MELKTKFINHKGQLYKIKREINEDRFSFEGRVELDWVKEYRDYIACDHVLKMKSYFLFCEEVTDIEWEEVI